MPAAESREPVARDGLVARRPISSNRAPAFRSFHPRVAGQSSQVDRARQTPSRQHLEVESRALVGPEQGPAPLLLWVREPPDSDVLM